MDKKSFKNDYSEGAHPKILEALVKTNESQEEGYGDDTYTQKAVSIIKNLIQDQSSHIHLVSGGTQANLIVISSLLKPYESVISASTGHIAVHEAGAIEASGHKINTVITKNGKLNPSQIKEVLDFHIDEHMVKPKLVFISNSTEIGSIYTKKELKKLSLFCREKGLILYMDGARLASALTSHANDLSLAEISSFVDVFYIGGTKNGALFGEAIIINNENLKENFRYNLKLRGALLAKGRVLGVQFLELFTNNLFFKLGQHANSMSTKIFKVFEDLGFKFLTKPVSNQIFPILPNKIIDKLSLKYEFYIWKNIDEKRSAIRLVTSWATEETIVNRFILDLKKSVDNY